MKNILIYGIYVIFLKKSSKNMWANQNKWADVFFSVDVTLRASFAAKHKLLSSKAVLAFWECAARIQGSYRVLPVSLESMEKVVKTTAFRNLANSLVFVFLASAEKHSHSDALLGLEANRLLIRDSENRFALVRLQLWRNRRGVFCRHSVCYKDAQYVHIVQLHVGKNQAKLCVLLTPFLT